jgi:hypothetical protein
VEAFSHAGAERDLPGVKRLHARARDWGRPKTPETRPQSRTRSRGEGMSLHVGGMAAGLQNRQGAGVLKTAQVRPQHFPEFWRPKHLEPQLATDVDGVAGELSVEGEERVGLEKDGIANERGVLPA